MSDMPLPAESEDGKQQDSRAQKSARYASYVFWVMFAINFFNYLDRYILPGALSSISADLHLSFGGAGLLTSAFLTVYAICALPLGYWADRGIRKNVISLGVGLWSIATFISGFAVNIPTLFIGRAAVGVGEAGYYPAGTSLLSDYFPSKRRAQILSRWTAGSLIGLALGFAIGGEIADIGTIGGISAWRFAFFVAGIPGLFFTYLAYRLREPRRGQADGWVAGEPHEQQAQTASSHAVPLGRAFKELLSIRTIVITITVQILAFWVLGSAANWLPIYLQLRFGISEGNAGLLSGAVLVIAGILGALLGGWLADLCNRRWISGRLIVGALGFFVSAPLIALALISPSLGVFLPFFFLTGMLLNVYNGPLSALSQDVVRPELRAMSVAISLLIAHLLGDATSSFQIGLLINKLSGHPVLDLLNQSGGNLSTQDPGGIYTATAMLITMPVLLALAGLIGLLGINFVRKDLKIVESKRQERVQVTA
ncbi:MAG TPA: MFS transporter [Ktedonobacterales bacterium]|jgi:MFS family permease